ncbi:molybdenum cofactor guanylyltransferase MobA [Paracoccus pacificus]|uniref:Molybdenum cofactor guanylyltransferase n=1 Tax=Paracoccus pacificus TaxID=1463598 RepID=A0ABW4R7A9_9RHOB
MRGIAGLVLAGGLGRRMGGRDKALIPLAGRPMIAHVIDALSPQCAALAISANGDPQRFGAFGLPVLPDPLPDHPGPLAGLLAGMEWAAGNGFSRIVTSPVDTPQPPGDLVARLSSVDAAVVLPRGMTADGSRLHPTSGLWRCDLAPLLRLALDRGVRKVRVFADMVGFAQVAFPGDEPFANLNTPEAIESWRNRRESAK